MKRLKFLVFSVLILFVQISAFPVFGRNLPGSPSLSHRISKRSPLELTVLEDDPTTPRTHPPSPEDLEERRKTLLAALIPESSGGGGGALGSQVQSLTDLGLDFVGGAINNAGELFAPLRNATQKAREGLPRVGTIINRFTDGARKYRMQIGGNLRKSATSAVNNGIRLFTMASARGTEVLGGVFKILRTMLDNLTLAVNNIVQRLSTGVVRVTKAKSEFLARNVIRARTALDSGRILKPILDIANIGTSIGKGIAQDLTNAQPLISEGVKSKIEVVNRLTPRVRLSDILAPEKADCGDETFNQKRESSESEMPESISDSSGELIKSTTSENDVVVDADEGPLDIDMLELLASMNKDVKSEFDGTTEKSSESVTTEKQAGESSEPNSEKSDSKNNTTSTVAVTTEVSKSESSPTTSTENPAINDKSYFTTTKSAVTSESEGTSTTISSPSIEDLFGITSKSSSKN